MLVAATASAGVPSGAAQERRAAAPCGQTPALRLPHPRQAPRGLAHRDTSTRLCAWKVCSGADPNQVTRRCLLASMRGFLPSLRAGTRTPFCGLGTGTPRGRRRGQGCLEFCLVGGPDPQEMNKLKAAILMTAPKGEGQSRRGPESAFQRRGALGDTRRIVSNRPGEARVGAPVCGGAAEAVTSARDICVFRGPEVAELGGRDRRRRWA